MEALVEHHEGLSPSLLIGISLFYRAGEFGR